MGIEEFCTPASELQASTERHFIYEYATMNPPDTQMGDHVPDTNTHGLDGIYVFYGLGGIIIFFVVYMLFYHYFLRCRDVIENQETELRELNQRALQEYNERAARISQRRPPPMNPGRIIFEDLHQRVTVGATMPTLAEGSCIQRNPEYLNVRENQADTRIMDLPLIPYRTPQEILEEYYMPVENGTLHCEKEIGEASVDLNAENPETLGRVESWMSEPPLCFSTPLDSNETIFSPEDLLNLPCPKSEQMQKDSSNERKSDADNATPTKCGEKESSPTPKKSDSDNVTPTKGSANPSPSTTKGKSRSSPPSPGIVRRRLTQSDDTHERPSSWQ